MPFDVEMPDGTVIEDVPDGTPKDVILKKWQSSQVKAVTDQVASSENPVVRAVKNVPSSAANFVGSIAEAVLNPVQTGKGLLDAAAGGLQNLAYAAAPSLKPAEEGFFYSPRAEQVADAVGGFYKDRYGSLRSVGNTMVEDPVGFAADLSGVSGLTSMGLRTGGMANAANKAATVSKFTDPLYLAGKAATKVTKPLYRQVVGSTSGAGARVIDEAFKGDKAFVDAMRGKTSESEVVGMAKDSLENIREARGTAYRQQLENLQSAKQELPIDDIKSSADEWLKRYNVKVTDEGLDFSRSSASGKSADEIKQVYEIVQDWGSKAGDKTPAMLDILKRKLDDFYTEGRTSRAMVTGLKKQVTDKLVKAVPEYAEMTKDYAKATEMIQEVEKALGAGKRSSADTALRKIIMAVKEDKNFRSDLIKVLDESGGQDLMSAASGVAMNPLASRSLGSMTTTAAGGVAALLASPKLAALMALASPRLVGETTLLLGRIGRKAPYGRGAGILAYQTGRLPLEE